ncbi:translation elongation factor Ts [Cylindrospermum stagnale PCC 7417]|uniref:Elongation factor Ts n=2 Tax=Cylindrospermum stagnale TaxID=142864 RepID=K9X061_9NOST|nr:translation elongation factor Ts [Cylindrospermum stagnale PCC 7417]
MEISAQVVKQLREKTGAGMMNCKQALKETNGDINKAIAWLQQKSFVTCNYTRIATEGLISSYIHTGGKVGVLLEVNCETDFVSRSQEFQTLVRDIAMQIAAYANIEYIHVVDIPAEVIAQETEIEIGRDDLANKPDNIKDKIIQGRIEKRLKEMSLMDQPYMRSPAITVEQHIKQAIAKLGENIQVRRFNRFVLGQGIEKPESHFAQEVASQIRSK